MRGNRHEHDGMYFDAMKLMGIPIYATEINKRLRKESSVLLIGRDQIERL